MSTVDELQDFATYELFINGSWEKSSDGRRIERSSPSDGRLIGNYARATLQDVDRAVDAARHAFDDTTWPTLAAPKRAQLLQEDFRAAARARRRDRTPDQS